MAKHTTKSCNDRFQQIEVLQQALEDRLDLLEDAQLEMAAPVHAIVAKTDEYVNQQTTGLNP